MSNTCGAFMIVASAGSEDFFFLTLFAFAFSVMGDDDGAGALLRSVLSLGAVFALPGSRSFEDLIFLRVLFGFSGISVAGLVGFILARGCVGVRALRTFCLPVVCGLLLPFTFEAIASLSFALAGLDKVVGVGERIDGDSSSCVAVELTLSDSLTASFSASRTSRDLRALG